MVHSCDNVGPDDAPYAAVSKLPHDYFVQPRNVPIKEETLKKIIKAFRLDARDPAVGHFSLDSCGKQGTSIFSCLGISLTPLLSFNLLQVETSTIVRGEQASGWQQKRLFGGPRQLVHVDAGPNLRIVVVWDFVQYLSTIQACFNHPS